MKDTLKKLGIEVGEIDTFLVLLSLNSGLSAMQLAKARRIPRPTVYGHLDSLIEKGLVKKGLSERGAIFYAESKEAISDLFDRRIKSLQQAQADIVQQFNSFVSTPVTIEPKFIVYEGANAAEDVFWDILRSQEKHIVWMWPINQMDAAIPHDVFRMWTRERVKRGKAIRVIWPELPKKKFTAESPYPMSELPNPLREVRILPEPIAQEASYAVYGTKVAFLSAIRENFGFIIDSVELSTTLKNEFEYLWKLSKPYSFESNKTVKKDSAK